MNPRLNESKSITLPLQGNQKTIYLSEKIYSGKSVWHDAFSFEITPNLERLRIAFKKLIIKHASLNSHFIETNNIVLQEFLPVTETTFNDDFPFKIINKEDYDANAFMKAPFKLDKGPLWRCALVKISENRYQLVLVFHHLIWDGRSGEIFKRDLSRFYNDPSLKAEPVSLITAVQTEKDFEEKLTFWQDNLKGVTALDLKGDKPPIAEWHSSGDRVPVELDEKTTSQLIRIADQLSITPNMLLLTCFYIWLHRTTGESDICVATASANRKRESVDMTEMHNCFFNSVLLRLLVADKSFSALANDLKTLTKNAYQHQVPFDILSKKIPGVQVNTFFVLQPPRLGITLDNTTSSLIDHNLQHSRFQNFGVNLFQSENGKTISGYVEYNCDKFSPAFIKSFVNHFLTILEKVCLNPDIKISAISYLSLAEKEAIECLNATDKPHITTDFIPQLFAKRLKEAPDADAFVFHQAPNHRFPVKYKEADHISDILAAMLYEKNARRNTCVGICLPRSPQLMAALLATLKTGSTIVPLETNPDECPLVFHKLDQSKTELIIVDNSTKNIFADYAGPDLTIINLDEPIPATNLSFNRPEIKPEDIAYIMFTSGTTGKPQGVKISHETLLNPINGLIDRHYREGSKVLSTAPPTFDCFFFEWLQALVTKNGVVHYIQGLERLDAQTITRVINSEQLNLATLTPNLIDRMKRNQVSTSLYDLISMGDCPRRETLMAYQGIVRNEYGLTQVGIFSTENIWQPDDPHTCVGKPIRNTQVYILDQYNHICPPFVAGKIFIAGKSLGRYLDSKLNSEKYVFYQFDKANYCFHRNQDSSNEHKTSEVLLYDSGDLGSYIPTKTGYKLDFKGRSERRVKLHSSIQLHLGDIESSLLHSGDFKEVTITHDSNRGLIAYFVLKDETKRFSTRDLNKILRDSPLCSAVRLQSSLCIQKMPLNMSGKVNYKQLAEYKIPSEPIIEPTTPLQNMLRDIWGEALNIDPKKISTDQYFSELGGTSLHLAVIAERINSSKLLGKEITDLKTLFPSRDFNISILEQEKILCALLKSTRLTCVHNIGHFKKSNNNIVYLHKENTIMIRK